MTAATPAVGNSWTSRLPPRRPALPGFGAHPKARLKRGHRRQGRVDRGAAPTMDLCSPGVARSQVLGDIPQRPSSPATAAPHAIDQLITAYDHVPSECWYSPAVCLCAHWAASTVRARPSRMVVRQMDYAELLQQVQAAAAVDLAAAEHVSLVTVATLAERMSHAELVRLGARLPDELQAAVRGGSPTCQPFGADEFVRRVAERMGVGPQGAWTQVRAVLGTLKRGVAEMEEVRQRLPRDFDALMAWGPPAA